METDWSADRQIAPLRSVRKPRLQFPVIVCSTSFIVSVKVWDLSFASYWAGASCKVTMVGHLHTVRCLQVRTPSTLRVFTRRSFLTVCFVLSEILLGGREEISEWFVR